jgi:phosphate uptake regulator
MTNQNKSERDHRRIQITGGSTYIISLPKSWVEKSGLSKGSRVHLIQKEDASLCIKPEMVEQPKKTRKAIITVSSGDPPESVVRRLISTYITGYNIIQIKSHDKRIDTDVKVSVKEIVRKKLVGTEILSESPEELTLQILLSYSELPINDALKRMAAMTASMHRDAIQALRSGDARLAKEVIEGDDEVNRFNLYIIRLLKLATSNPQLLDEIGIANSGMCLGYRLIAKAVERTADHAVNIARNRLSMKDFSEDQVLDDLGQISEAALRLFEAAVETVFMNSYAEAENIIMSAEEARRMSDEVALVINNAESTKDYPQIRLIMESIIRTSEYAKDIAEIVLNMTISDVVVEA